MQALASAYSAYPEAIAVAALFVVASLAVVAWRLQADKRKSSDPLKELIQSGSIENCMNEIAERRANDSRDKHRLGSVLHARIDHFQKVGQVWGENTRADAIDEVARVLRAGVRDGDEVEPGIEACEDQDGSFVINARGASEAEASVIAQRLLQALAHTPFPGMGKGMRLTASIGVAERHEGEDSEAVSARASAALDAAQARGEDQVIAASEWEEIKLLPAPSPSKADEADAASTADEPSDRAA